MPDASERQLRNMAEQVRRACLTAAVEAYEDAGLRGLCADGRWECARRAIAALDLESVVVGDKASVSALGRTSSQAGSHPPAEQ